MEAAADVRLPSLVPPLTQFHMICPSTATGPSGFHFVDEAAPPRALYNYMHGIGLDEDVRAWFDDRVPKPRVGRHFIARALAGS